MLKQIINDEMATKGALAAKLHVVSFGPISFNTWLLCLNHTHVFLSQVFCWHQGSFVQVSFSFGKSDKSYWCQGIVTSRSGFSADVFFFDDGKTTHLDLMGDLDYEIIEEPTINVNRYKKVIDSAKAAGVETAKVAKAALAAQAASAAGAASSAPSSPIAQKKPCSRCHDSKNGCTTCNPEGWVACDQHIGTPVKSCAKCQGKSKK